MRSLLALVILFLSVDALACGKNKYELRTEVEMNGRVVKPKIVATYGETVSTKVKTGDIETGVMVLAEEVWDENHQGDAVKLDFKISQSKGRLSLGYSSQQMIVRYGETAEMEVRDDAPDAKPVRLKVTAKKI